MATWKVLKSSVIWIIKYDSTLNVLQQFLQILIQCTSNQIVEFSSHYYLLGYGGMNALEVNGNNDIVITKITLDGKVVWTRLLAAQL